MRLTCTTNLLTIPLPVGTVTLQRAFLHENGSSRCYPAETVQLVPGEPPENHIAQYHRGGSRAKVDREIGSAETRSQQAGEISHTRRLAR